VSKKLPARHAGSPDDYRRLGLEKEVAQWEDGVRTTGKKGEYEWWYFDAKLDSGHTLVIVFFTAPMTADKKGYAPSVMFTLTGPEGKKLISEHRQYAPGKASFAKAGCRVKIGFSTFEGDLREYRIHYETENVEADVELHANVPSWRPGTGHIFFGEDKYFAWLPAVPEGRVKATITADEETIEYTGTGYHDHNWGNVGMYRLMHHWYWGRAKIGEYQVITSYITGQEKYGYAHFPVFMLAKGGRILAENASEYLTYTQEDPEEIGGKHLFKTLIYEYDDERQHYRVTYRMQRVLEQMTDHPGPAPSGLMKLGMKLLKLEPGYIRVTGTAVLEKLEGGQVTEREEAPAVWELMYFGEDKDV